MLILRKESVFDVLEVVKESAFENSKFFKSKNEVKSFDQNHKEFLKELASRKLFHIVSQKQTST